MRRTEGLKRSLRHIDNDAVSALITAAADIALVVDGKGVIQDVALGSEELAAIEYGDWLGRAWKDIVTVESREKVDEMLRDAATDQPPRWRQVNHPSSNGGDIPVRYSTVQLGNGGSVVAVGRELKSMSALQQRMVAAQQAMEREYERLRQAETRYRLLFQLSSEAVLIIEASTGKIVEANPVAGRLMNESPQNIVGRPFLEAFDPESRANVSALLGAAKATGQADTIRARLTDHNTDYELGASLFRQGSATYYLAKIAAIEPDKAREQEVSANSALLEVVEKSPDGFVVADSDWRILAANGAFLDMTEMATEEQIRGQPLMNWLGRSGVDFNVLVANLREYGTIRLFGTVMRGQYGATVEVEVSAVSALHGDQACYGMTVRNVSRRFGARPSATGQLPQSANQFTELVGRVPLKEIVRETTDLIERLCIEAALDLTDNNRASASELLGLSRQSLYVKLRRFDIADGDNDDTDA